MNKNVFILIFVFLSLIDLTFAIDFVPQGNINLKGYYKILNASSIDIINFTISGQKVQAEQSAFKNENLTGKSVNFTNGNLSQNLIVLGNIGIGTTNPTEKLQIGDGTTGANIILKTSGGGSYILFDSTGTDMYFGHMNTISAIQLGPWNNILFNAMSTGTIGLGGNNASVYPKMIILNTGNVGIGTVNPLATLHINGSGANSGLLVSNGSGSNYTAFFVNSTSGNIGIGTNSPTATLHFVSQGGSWGQGIRYQLLGQTNNWEWLMDSATRLVIGYTGGSRFGLYSNGGISVGLNYVATTPPANGIIMSGYEGIGTSNPTSLLDILASDSINNSVTNVLTLEHNAINFTNQSARGNGVSILFKSNDNASQMYNLANISAILTNSTNGSQKSAITFSTTSSDTGDLSLGHLTEKMRIDSNGYVGIGKIPTMALDVTGNVQSSATIFSTNFKSNLGTAGAVGYAYSGNGSLGMFFPSTNSVGFSTNGNERMRIDTIGNVGIGTTSPNRFVVVSKNSTADNILLEIDNTYAQGYYGNVVVLSGYSNETDKAYASNRVGAGFTLQNKDTTDNNYMGYYFLNANSNNIVSITATAENQTGTAPAGSLQFFTRGGGGGITEAMRIASNQNVGIGTVTPSEKLTVNGNFSVGTNFIVNTNGNIGIGMLSSNATLGVNGNIIATNISASTKVGIGTNNPTNSLSINGSLANPLTSGTLATPNGMIRFSATGASRIMDFGLNAVTPIAGWIQSRDASSYASNYALALNPNGGFVGIGTLNPLATLHINASGVDGGLLVTNSSGQNVFFVNASNGKIGIGTKTPNASLTVVGNINATGTTELRGLVNINTFSINNATNNGMDRCILVAGTCTIPNTQITANTNIFCFEQTTGGTAGHIAISARSVGTSYTVTGIATDTSIVACMLIEPHT